MDNDNPWDVIRAALRSAREAQSAVDFYADQMADMLTGRLRRVCSVGSLKALKRELRDFDMVTGKWRKPK